MSRALAIGGMFASGGLALFGYQYLFGDVHTLKDIPPEPGDAAPTPGNTGRRRVDALLPKLRQMATDTGIPLGLIVAWVTKESGGRLAVHPQPGAGDTSMDERGFFQLTPAESKSFGLDHQRLSTDADYSLAAGPLLIRSYHAKVANLNVAAAPAGSSFDWILTKLWHTVGGGQTTKWVKAAQAAGAMGSWDEFKQFVMGQRWTGPQPKKWLPFLDSLYQLGRPFGFGNESVPLVAGFGGPCSYCADGYCEYCDGADGLGPCDCRCRQPKRSGMMAGLDYLAVEP